MNEHLFFPSAARARSIDRRMRAILGDSLDHIAARSSGILDFDSDALTRLAAKLREGDRYPPSTFGLYAELVLAIEAEDYAEAERLLDRLAGETPVRENPWQTLAYGEPRHRERDQLYLRFLDTDPDIRFGIVAPDPDAFSRFEGRLRSGYRLMAKAIPELAGEFDQLTSQVILVAADPKDRYQFDGGSSYMLWGGLFLNTASHENDVMMVEVLAHESAHTLLFGCASDEPLVLNEDDELYPSPLRVDPRPMDGIYHSTFVSARMHWAMSKLLESGLLNPEEAAAAEAARSADKKNFYDGHGVVAASGILTATGKAVMKAAKDYMDSAG